MAERTAGPGGTGTEDFYVGYRLRAPEAVRRFGRWMVPLVALVAAGLGALLAARQSPFDPGTFEFGTLGDYEGTLWSRPAPLLAVDAGTGGPPRLLPLVATGKHGADDFAHDLDGRRVALRGTRIERGDWLMLEVPPESVRDLGPGAPRPAEAPVGTLTARGEIVDGKCFLGVMKPGRDKLHRACAARCLSGGLPPMFWLPGGDQEWTFLLDFVGDPEPAEVAAWAGRPITLEGQVRRLGDAWVLRADPPRS